MGTSGTINGVIDRLKAVARPGVRVAIRVRRGMQSPQGRWRGGLEDERKFWDGAIARGGYISEHFQYKLDPESQLDEYVVRFLPATEHVRILDVGAGPLTTIGKRTPGHVLEISATDALADDYNRMLSDHGLKPPVATQRCETEDLSSMFAPDSFDIVHASNALDHHYDPRVSIEEMLKATRPGGVLIMVHAENEAERANYGGLHQFNFALPDGRPVLWNRRLEIDLDQFFAGRATRLCGERSENASGRGSVLLAYSKSEASQG